MSIEEVARIFKALGHPARLAIVLYLSRSRRGVVWEALANALRDYYLPSEIERINFHITELVKAGVIVKTKTPDGLWVYKLNNGIKEWIRLEKLKKELLINSALEGRRGYGIDEGATRGEIHSKRRGTFNTREEMEGARSRSIEARI
ncbi:ArsR family transcriptional regulator [Ignicoccus pacificus DSM 13166]|uniref:ArsR family transcriptional regulator n=1 Tax=Ignicoccus pacificus DSM 13166 TaxID=940294 RepID=A0A977PK06_9CREN|nr:ArsR family transcriptional regulator [Ignicoccus pacificus DSM 13166]